MSDASTITYQALDAPIVLLVEDEALIRMAMADALRDEGFVVIEASYPKEAMSAVKGGDAMTGSAKLIVRMIAKGARTKTSSQK